MILPFFPALSREADVAWSVTVGPDAAQPRTPLLSVTTDLHVTFQGLLEMNLHPWILYLVLPSE